MKSRIKYLTACGLISALALTGCSNSDDDDGGTQQSTAAALNYVFATDHQGYINIFTHNIDNTVSHVADFQPLNSTGGSLALGEIHIAHGKAFIIIQSGLTDESDAETGGGLAIVNLETMTIEEILSMPTTETVSDTGGATTSRFVHTYLDPDGTHLWMNNDGVSDNAPDSVFRVNINPMDMDATDGDKYKDFQEILVGHGHKKSAIAYPSDNAEDNGANALELFATHNRQEASISIIDNDATSPTFLEVLHTEDLGDSSQNAVHGMAYSKVSGHIYTGVTPGLDLGLSIIDVTNNSFTHSPIMAGMDMGMNQIPGGGYVKTTHDGRWVMTAGYVNEVGYLSIIDAKTDTVTDVIELGNLSSSSLNIAEMEMDMDDGMTMHHVKVLVPSRQTTDSETENTTQIAVIDFNHMTGTQTSGTSVRYVDVEEGPAHRNGKISSDGIFAYYPNGGDCGASHDAHGTGCTLISVINVMSEQVVAEMHTAGHEPGSIKVISAMELTGAGGGSGGGHMH